MHKSIYLKRWYVYILFCDDKYYTGITRDVQRRLEQHKTGKGAKYTRGRKVVELIYSKRFNNHRNAAIREIQIKKLSRAEKLKLIQVKKK